MSEVREGITKQEPYMKMALEKKTGKYAHVTVSITFLCPPEQFTVFKREALEELRDTVNVLTHMEDPEA
jgi:hypothetical protein